MEKDNIIKKIENRIDDLNYYINSDNNNEIKLYAWKYARIELENVLKMLLHDI